MVMTTEKDDSAIERLLQSRVATIFLDIGKVEPRVSNIRLNYERGIRQGVENLLQLGHRQMAFIGGPDHLISARLPRMAFMNAMRKYRSSPQTQSVICSGDF